MPDRLSHYELLNRIGVGGMGVVWRARDKRDDSIVAIKVLHQHLAFDDEWVRRFEREAQIAHNVDSLNVVRVLGSGHEDETYFLIMEYVPGETLSQLVAHKGKLPIDEAAAITAGIARGLDAANQKGIV